MRNYLLGALAGVLGGEVEDLGKGRAAETEEVGGEVGEQGVEFGGRSGGEVGQDGRGGEEVFEVGEGAGLGGAGPLRYGVGEVAQDLCGVWWEGGGGTVWLLVSDYHRSHLES